MLLLASAVQVPSIQSGNHLCMYAKKKKDSVIALCCECDEGVCILQMMEILGWGSRLVAASNCCALQKFAVIRYVHSVFTMHLGCLQLLVKQLSMCSRLSSRSSKGIRANEEWQVDRCEVEGENKCLWSVIANGWGWLGGCISYRGTCRVNSWEKLISGVSLLTSNTGLTKAEV